MSKLSDRFTFDSRADSGGSGFVFFGVQDATARPVAVKFYSLQESSSEVLDLATISSPNVIQVLDAGPVDESWAYFVTPKCQHGDFDQVRLGADFTQKDSVKSVLSVLEGLSHLHAAGFVHRDLKPSNVFMDAGGQAIIGDLGSIRRVPASGVVPGSAKTLFYIPPEVVQMGSYTFKSDLYQVGLMLFRFCGGHLPHEVGPWLDPKTVRALSRCTDGVQRTKLENQAVFTRIESGRAADLATLPAYTPQALRKIIRKSVLADSFKRHATASSFMAELHRAGTAVFPWSNQGSCYLLNSVRPKRVETNDHGQFTVRTKNNAGWRQLKNASFATLEEAFRFAENSNS